MVALAQRLAAEAGVSHKATFVQGDMFEADISEATVLALFLLPRNLEQFKAKMLATARVGVPRCSTTYRGSRTENKIFLKATPSSMGSSRRSSRSKPYLRLSAFICGLFFSA